MKKAYSYILIAFAFIFLAACTDTHYLAEKLFWQAGKKTKELVSRKSGKLTPKDYEKIVSYYREAIEKVPLDPFAAKAHFAIADLFLRQSKPDKAQKEFREIINNFSSNGETASKAYLNIGRIFEYQGKWNLAREEYDKIIDLYPMTRIGLNMPLYIMAHYKALKDKDNVEGAYKSALRHYNSMIEEYTSTSAAPLIKDYLSRLYLEKGKASDAIAVWDDLEKEYSSGPVAAKAILTKAFIYERIVKDTRRAIGEYKKFIKRYPKNKITPQIKLKTGILYYGNSDIAKAKEMFNELLKDYPDDANLRIKGMLGLAYCYRKEANTARVIEVYRRIKKEYPKSKAALDVPFLIAQYYQQEKYSSRADKAFREAIAEYKSRLIKAGKDNSPGKRAIADLLALCYLKNNDVDKAVSTLKELADTYTLDPAYLIDLASLYRNINAKDKATGVYRELIKRFPDNKIILKFANAQIKALAQNK